MDQNKFTVNTNRIVVVFFLFCGKFVCLIHVLNTTSCKAAETGLKDQICEKNSPMSREGVGERNRRGEEGTLNRFGNLWMYVLK